MFVEYSLLQNNNPIQEPAGFTAGEALEALGLNPANGPFEENKIRKAYFKMAQKYHPDKNPEGKEMFQKINKAYEHLASNKEEVCGPDPVNIRLGKQFKLKINFSLLIFACLMMVRCTTCSQLDKKRSERK